MLDMYLDIITIKKIASGPDSVIHYELEKLERIARDAGVCFLSPIYLDLDFKPSGENYLIQGHLKTEVEQLCSRCLKDYAHTIVADICGILTEDVDWYQLKAQEGNIYLLDQGFNLMPLVVEAIILNLPISPHCGANCQGLCPICGINRNIATCDCEPRDTDPRWEKLKKIKK